MRTFSRLVIRFRWVLLIALTAATVVFGFEIGNMSSNYEFESWLPDKDDVAELVREVDKDFSSTMVMFAVLDFGEKGVFHTDSLALVHRITGELEEMEGLFDVTSLLNVIDIRKTDDGIRVGDLIQEIPRTDAGMRALKAYVLGRERYVDSIVSKDARFTVVIIYIDSSFDELKVAKHVIERVKRIAGDQPCAFGGDPAVAHFMSQYSNQDFKRLVPAMLVVMIFVLAFGLRRVFGVVLPLCFVVICIVWTFGLKAILHYPFNMLSPSVAVMLIAIGSDYAVHIYNHFLRRGDIVESMSEITLPVVMSALTTVIGLLTFSVTGIPNLKYFGAELAIGLSSACFVSVILLPIFIHLLRAKPGPVVDGTQTSRHFISRALFSLGNRVYHRSWVILVVTCILMAVMGVGITRISTDVDFVSLLPKESSPRQANRVLGEHFGGMYANTVYFQGDLGDPTVLAQQLYVENFLRSEGMLASFNSLNGYIAEENWLFSGVFSVPETREGVSGLWLLLESEDMMDMIVTPERDKGLVTSFIRSSSTGKILAVSERIKAFLDRETSDTVLKLDPGQLAPASQEALEELRIKDTARQLVWLAGRYAGGVRCDSSQVYQRLANALPAVKREQAFPAVMQEIRSYLDEDTVEVLPGDLVGSLMETVREHKEDLFGPDFEKGIAQRIVDRGIMDTGEARRTVQGLLERAESLQRIKRADLLWRSVRDLLPAVLRQNEHYEKRAKGVLWTLLGDHPVFFAKQVSGIPDVNRGVIETREIRIRQAGFPEIIARLEAVLLHSQYSSLILASGAVFLLVSITQFSLRRGVASLLSVLVPLELMLGMMGWFGIPLDFGTVLNGALVIGLGIDGSIHFLHYYHHLREEKIEREQALPSAMGHVGRAVVTANATTFGGFLILLFAHTSAVRNFAITTGMAILFVSVAVLTVLPALVVLLGLDKDRNMRIRARRKGSQ